jgi:Mitochondrial glycoprotein
MIPRIMMVRTQRGCSMQGKIVFLSNRVSSLLAAVVTCAQGDCLIALKFNGKSQPNPSESFLFASSSFAAQPSVPMRRLAAVATASSSRTMIAVRTALFSTAPRSLAAAAAAAAPCRSGRDGRTTSIGAPTRRHYGSGYSRDLPPSPSVAGRPSSLLSKTAPPAFGGSLSYNCNCYCYSTSAPALLPSSSASTVLADILTRERAEEVEHATLAVPPELADLRAKLEAGEEGESGGGGGGWKIVDVGATTRLTKPLASRGKAVVHFHCQDVIEELDEDAFDDDDEDHVEAEAAAGDEEEAATADEEEEMAGAVRFVVAVSYPAQKTLLFQCVTDFGQVQIRSAVTTSQSVDELFQQSGGAGGGDLSGGGGTGDPKDYQGPVFDELAQDLQQAFHQYLAQEIGVNEDVAAFVSMHADHREQASYVKFLDECHGVVKASSSSSS